MKPIYKYLIVFAIGCILSVVATCDKQEPSVILETKTDTIVKTVVKDNPIRFIDTVFVKSKPITITVPDNTTLEADSTIVNTRKYVGKEDLDNGTINYEIYADSLYATKFKLTTKDTSIIKETTKTITLPPKSKLFISGGLESSISNIKVPQSASIGLMYNRRQKWGAGVEVRQDFSGLIPPQNSTTIGVKVYIGL